MRRHVALPSDHGSWVFLASPLAVGLAAGGRPGWGSAALAVGALAGFLLRQPVTLLVKIAAGRRGRGERREALGWIAAYGTVALGAAAALALAGFTAVLWLAAPGLPIFAWYLGLVARREERRQMAVELLAIGALALAAPGAMWVGRGGYDARGWLLWLLVWMLGAVSIVYVYARLSQRVLAAMPDRRERLRIGGGALAASGGAIGLVAGLAAAGVVPVGVTAPFAVLGLEAAWGILARPAVGWKPTALGWRQLAVSAIATALLAIGWSV